jgi:hypothetical protein
LSVVSITTAAFPSAPTVPVGMPAIVGRSGNPAVAAVANAEPPPSRLLEPLLPILIVVAAAVPMLSVVPAVYVSVVVKHGGAREAPEGATLAVLEASGHHDTAVAPDGADPRAVQRSIPMSEEVESAAPHLGQIVLRH